MYIRRRWREDQYVRMINSFSPSKTKPLLAGSALKGVTCKWETLRDVANLDAYYVYRLCQASTPMEFDGNNLTWFDNIYLQRLTGKGDASGLNRGEVVVGKNFNPKPVTGILWKSQTPISAVRRIFVFSSRTSFL